MPEMTLQETVNRLKANEERFSQFLNELGEYQTIDEVPVETIRSFLARKEIEVNGLLPAANAINADDGAGGSLWVSVQGFINRIKSALGAGSVGYTPAGTDAVATTVEEKLQESISAEDYSTIENAILNAGTSEIIKVAGTPAYTSQTQWNGRQHQTDESPFNLNNVTWPGANLGARMCVNNGYLYSTEYTNNKVAVFSLANPRNPQYIVSFDTGSEPRHIDVVGRFAFVCCHGAAIIEVHDLSNPSQPTGTIIGSIAVGANPKMFQIVGNEIFVACFGTSTVEKYIFSLPAFGTSGFSSVKTGQVSVSSGPLCLAHNGAGLIAVCGLNTANVQIVGGSSLNLISTAAIGGAGHGTCVWVNKTQLLVTDSTNDRLYSCDCSSLTATVTAFADTSPNPEQIEIVGNRCYVPSLTDPGVPAFLDCFDITEAQEPIKFKSVPLTVTGAGFTAYFTDGKTGYVYVNGHFAPYNIDVVEVVEGPSGRIPLYAVETFGARSAGFGSVDSGSQSFRFATKLANYNATASDFVIRLGLGADVALFDPSSADGKVLIIENVSTTAQSLVTNAFAGYSGTLRPLESVVLAAQQFGGAYQWDRIAGFLDKTYSKYTTQVANYNATLNDDIIRVGAGAAVALPDPSMMLGKVITIKNTSGVSNSNVTNGFLGYSGTLTPGQAVTVAATEFSGTSQWDAIASF